MTQSTKGWLQYIFGGILYTVSLLFALPLLALQFDWPFVGKFGAKNTFVVWDVITLNSREFNIFFILAFMAGSGFISLGFVLLSRGRKNIRLAEGRRP